MTPIKHTLTDENLRRLLLAESISPPPAPRVPWYETAALTGLCVFFIAFLGGLLAHILTDI